MQSRIFRIAPHMLEKRAISRWVTMTMLADETQGRLDLHPGIERHDEMPPFVGPCALEDDDFPFEAISDVAEVESWRKELNRPIYHIHKWWAQRLGTVFRALALGAFAPSGTDIRSAFYRRVRARNRIVFDPFMGSGTSIGEAAKLGARVIGRDINPVAHFLVRNALAHHDREAVSRTFKEIESDVADQIRSRYKTAMPDGAEADVLYYFWVKQVDCPECSTSVDLFSTRIFAKHACPSRHPNAKAICPDCGEVNDVLHDANRANCRNCNAEYDPQSGPAKGHKAICPNCGRDFPIAKTVREKNAPPEHRLYAKLALASDGKKVYSAASDEDLKSYLDAEEALAERPNAYPVVGIGPGCNTNQALGYNYRHWHEMFNSRQLLCLSILGDRIREIPEPALRDLFTCLFSGMLEFNNLFASYKGEGTGAVRHMFSHHILKPERVPVEANIWGTPKSSGSFMTMFERRICRALDYAECPFELKLHNGIGNTKKSEKIFGLAQPLGFEIAEDFMAFKDGKSVYLSCGDSSATDIEDGIVDAIITDPPFFDNVHYSQLADFFHVWQRHLLDEKGTHARNSTRSSAEVQNADAAAFTERLSSVLIECHRVLSDNGVLAFTYHHSRSEGWSSVLHALMKADFGISAAFPIKAELSVAMPKHQAKEPIDLDIILVCRKRITLEKRKGNGDLWEIIRAKAAHQVSRLRQVGRKLSRNDVKIIVMAQLVLQLSRFEEIDAALGFLHGSASEIGSAIETIHDAKMSDFVEAAE